MPVPTLSSTWQDAAGIPLTEELLEWPPDVLAFANLILSHSEAFRFVLSPIEEWPPRRHPAWVEDVAEAALAWSAWAEHGRGTLPHLVVDMWRVVRERADNLLEHVAEGRDDRLGDSLLTLHAVADEACAGLGVALDTFDDGCWRGEDFVFARARVGDVL